MSSGLLSFAGSSVMLGLGLLPGLSLGLRVFLGLGLLLALGLVGVLFELEPLPKLFLGLRILSGLQLKLGLWLEPVHGIGGGLVFGFLLGLLLLVWLRLARLLFSGLGLLLLL